MNILITAFEAFNGESVNPAQLATADLPEHIEHHPIDVLVIPTSFKDSVVVIKSQLAKKTYDVVIAVGQAGGRSAITPERIAINIDDAVIPDNTGEQPINQPIQPKGPAAYFSDLPVKRMVQHLREAGTPSELSNTAGTFVCNHVMYQLAHLAKTSYPNMRTGFIHLPYATEQVQGREKVPAMPVSTMTRGLMLAIQTAIQFSEDSDGVLGTLS
ncbi:pyroglutamyl-peptidase I [Staphylococcus chromogenes]|uniref:pyroglutamyl-peptidase I n=1 Tax=Staphylococcus TaxID=1279 RepID=UPI0014034CAB|nr:MULTISPECIES: pyroglutamyl-peptidase I [Staphylococcus]MDU0477053.1 pyroglutamyl-peptidase I [Staphylococcus chromogenes]MEB7450323.1 pyroglutamyl-peptidase I [Staphylococcus chromogenes]NHM78196.1 pyroglutamyl-peptidase I [Staphylococcus sp. 11511212]